MEVQVVKKESVKSLLWDIIVDVSWANISDRYFGKSRSWISQKFSEVNGNGVATDFTEIERENLKNALMDLSKRIEKCAAKL